MATSRFIPDIEAQFAGSLITEVRGHPDDIRRFLVSSVIHLRPFVRRSVELQKEVLDSIASSVDGMFLLAQLYMQSLEEKATPKAIRLALKRMPKLERSATNGHSTDTRQAKEAYDVSYEDAMERITTQHPDSRQLAVRVLAWISAARRPLQTSELRHALAVEPDEDQFDQDNIPAIEDMLSVCAGLVTVDEQSHIVRLTHYTTQEYFERTWRTWFPRAHDDICEICLEYLLGLPSHDWDFRPWCLTIQKFDRDGALCRYIGTSQFIRMSMTFSGIARLHASKQIRNLRQKSHDFRGTHPFYEYAAENWGWHCHRSSLDGSSRMFDFFDSEPNFLPDASVSAIDSYAILGNIIFPTTPLHVSAFFGLSETVRILLDRGCPPNMDDTQTVGPLHLAAFEGHLDVVKLLLERGALPDRLYQGATPFFIACERRHLDTAKALLGRGADPNIKFQGYTPLSLAVGNRETEVAQYLIAQDEVILDAKNPSGLNPLMRATRNHDLDILSALLKHGKIAKDEELNPDPKSLHITDRELTHYAPAVGALLFGPSAFQRLGDGSRSSPEELHALNGFN